MKRDNDYIRELLLTIESDPQFDGTRQVQPGPPSEPGRSYDDLAYHLTLLIEAGFVVGQPTMQMPFVSRLTWEGHEFLDDIRDPDVWSKTKERMKGLGSVGLNFVWEIAKAEIKTKLGLP
jgi:hypothetical protein